MALKEWIVFGFILLATLHDINICFRSTRRPRDMMAWPSLAFIFDEDNETGPFDSRDFWNNIVHSRHCAAAYSTLSWQLPGSCSSPCSKLSRNVWIDVTRGYQLSLLSLKVATKISQPAVNLSTATGDCCQSSAYASVASSRYLGLTSCGSQALCH